MAYENINIVQHNFCTGPQIGTICTLDTSSSRTVLKIKNMTGGSIMDLTLSSNILNDNVRIEYIGPKNLNNIIDDLVFFTFEKVSDTKCMIKRWSTRIAFRELILKEQVIKSNSGNEFYNAIDFSVEYYNSVFTKPNEYYNYLDMTNISKVKTGTKLFLGPSTDADNFGAVEVATVSHIIDYIGGKRVYLTSPLKFQYVTDDPIIFYNNVYIYSKDGYAGDTSKGTLFKIDAYSWVTKEIDLKSIYKKVTAAKWCPTIGGIASVIGTNILFIRPYDSYQIWRSMFINNVEEDDNSIYPVYDLIFDNNSIYKLQNKITLRDDFGNKTTYDWDNYNYQSDTLLPYTNSVVSWANNNVITGYNKDIDINIQVRDQFHIGLRDVNIEVSIDGDPEAILDPISGLLITDFNGSSNIIYTSGFDYTGNTKINIKASGSSSSTGSQYVLSTNNIFSYIKSDIMECSVFQKIPIGGEFSNFKQVRYEYKVYDLNVHKYVYPNISLFGKSFFSTPGADWGPVNTHGYASAGYVNEWLPLLYKEDNQLDAPKDGIFQNNLPTGIKSNQITLFLDTEASNKVKSVTDFLLYHEEYSGIDGGIFPNSVITSPDESSKVDISQLNLSLHTYWANNISYDYIWTDVEIDQFIFVEDAIPKFYSEKNPIETNIWIRLRPFAFSLNLNSLRMWVREVTHNNDTGFVEVTGEQGLYLNTFDAGSGNLGIEVTYNPIKNFNHDSIVFIKIDVYDEAYIPNFITVEYWFKVVPDFNAPYLLNFVPDIEAINVPIDTNISFEIKDNGTGVDIDSLECLFNSRRMHPNDLDIEKFSKYHYKVTYNIPENLQYNKNYKVNIKVNDLTPYRNALNYSYRFYTLSSNGVVIQDPNPKPCKAGMGKFQSVDVKVLSNGNGVDLDSIRMQVYNKDVTVSMIPILYRIS